MVHRMMRWGAAALTMSALGWASPAMADDDGVESVARVYPVQGRIQHDAALVGEPVGMRFSVASEGWSEEWSDLDTRSCAAADCRVPVADGRFRVPLGRHVSLDAVVLEATDFVISVEVYDAEAAEWQSLGALLETEAMPHAMWTTTTSTISAGTLSVGGDLTGSSGAPDFDSLTIEDVFGSGSSAGAVSSDGVTVTTGSTDIGGDLSVSGTVSAATLDVEGAIIAGSAGEIFGYTGDVLDFGPDTDSISISTTLLQMHSLWIRDSGSIDLNGTIQAPHWGLSHDQRLFYSSATRWDPDDYSERSGYFLRIPAEEWYCWNSGIEFTNADWCTSGAISCRGGASGSACSVDSDCDDFGMGYCSSGECVYYPMLSAFAFPTYTGGDYYWGMQVDSSSTDTEEVAAQWMCADISIVDFLCSDGSGHVSRDCASEISADTSLGTDDDHSTVRSGRWPPNYPTDLGDAE